MSVKLSQLRHDQLHPDTSQEPTAGSSMASAPPDSEQVAQGRSSHEEHVHVAGSGRSPSVTASKPSSFLYFSRHTLGLLLIVLVVVLWVSANFITWALFSDDTYSKPYLVTYMSSAMFMVYLIPWLWRGGISELKSGWSDGERPWSSWAVHNGVEYTRIGAQDDVDNFGNASQGKLGLFATIRLSAEFAILWWLANYYSSVCYLYTSAASGSILSSTSSESYYLINIRVGLLFQPATKITN